MDDLEKLVNDKEFERFQAATGKENDPIILLLRSHLYSESLLERIITFMLPRGDKLIENGNLTYHNKLVVVEALDCLPDIIVSSLRNLNKVRNQCAHELNRKITDGDITRIGSPLGKEFTRLKRKAKFDDTLLLRFIVAFICGHMSTICLTAEHTEINQIKQN